jgi:energy-coupling factor transporter ATP-binding protein EcfA2
MPLRRTRGGHESRSRAGTEEEASPPDASNFDIGIEAFELTNGQKITVPNPGVTAIVGGNNVGKSTTLRDIKSLLENAGGSPMVGWRLVERIDLVRSGSSDDLLAWLGTHSQREVRDGYPVYPTKSGDHIREEWLVEEWARFFPSPIGYLSKFFLNFADAFNRIGVTLPVEQREDIGQTPVHPLHHLQDSEEMLSQLKLYVKRIFNQDLTLDRLSGNVSLRVGSIDMVAPPVDSVTSEYRQAMSALPHLQHQGDGMRSLIGLLLPIIAGTDKIVLVDEPEAFLHPPQARALGSALGKLAVERDLQIILATHDRNILLGLLDVHDLPLSVVRLNRVGSSTTAHALESEALREYRSEPRLRYSNLLDGLFHSCVVVAEADQDCRFYSVALESMEDGSVPFPTGEVLFVPSGGKGAIPKLVAALQALDVAVVVSPDLDILDDEGLMGKVVRSLGSSWNGFQSDYAHCTQSFRTPTAQATCRDVRTAILAVLEGRDEEPFDSSVGREIASQMRTRESPWSAVKRYGVQAFRGEASTVSERLLDGLDSIGLVLVRVGELENFAKQFKKGPGWLPAALEAGAHLEPEVVDHLRRLLNSAVRS